MNYLNNKKQLQEMYLYSSGSARILQTACHGAPNNVSGNSEQCVREFRTGMSGGFQNRYNTSVHYPFRLQIYEKTSLS